MIKLLIVEDEEAHQELIETALRDFGRDNNSWQVTDRLEEARKILRSEDIDLILLDLSLPDSAPNETLPRALDFARDTPIIVLTSLDNRHTIMNMIRRGAKDCIPKSMLNGLLLERSITYCLDRERLGREQVRRERELEQAVSFHRLFNRSKIGFLIKDPQFRIIEANPAFCEWLGYSREDLIGKDAEKITAEEHRETSLKKMKAVREGEAREQWLEKQYIRADGERAWGNVVIKSIQWQNQSNCLILSIFDLTERKEAEERLAEAYESKSGIVSMISHDVRAPITNIIAMAEFLQESELPEDVMECVAGISKSGRTVLEIVDDMLTYSHAEQGALKLEEASLNMGSLIDEVLRIYQSSADKKGVRLVTDAVDRDLTLVLDPNRLQQVIANLISNAIKFSPEAGEVRLSAGVAEGELTISVTDAGIGISQEEQKRLFRPFSQANPRIQKQFGGTGLGLSICKQLTSLMGGSIEVESEPGKGSTFTVRIPAVSA